MKIEYRILQIEHPTVKGESGVNAAYAGTKPWSCGALAKILIGSP